MIHVRREASEPRNAERGAWLEPSVLASLGDLELIARTVVEGFLNGLHRSLRSGFSLEFADYRAYVPGDDPRFIDWNAEARSGRTYLKRYVGETTTQLMILLDASASMGVGTAGVGKLRYATFLCAALAMLASRQHDPVGLIVFDEEIREQRAPSTRPAQLHGLLHVLERTQARAGTEPSHAFELLRRRASRRGLVAVVSDFYGEPSAWLECVRPFAYRGHDVMLLQVLDPEERAFELATPSLLVDVETRAELEVAPAMARAQRERMQRHIEALQSAASGAGADHVLLDTSQPLDEALRAYLAFRRRRA
jgi:uncharacterized protein (DUF58 family)